MPEEGIICKTKDETLDNREIVRFVKIVGSLGVRHITLLGGEPLLKENFTELLRELKTLPEIEKISVLSNGTLLYSELEKLRDAGLDEIAIHLDATQSHLYKRLTRGKISSAEVLKAIWKGVSLDMPVRIFCVLQEAVADEIPILAGLAKQYSLSVDFSELLPIRWDHEADFFSSKQAIEKLKISYTDLCPDGKPAEDGIWESYQSGRLKGRIRFLSKGGEAPFYFLYLSCDGKLAKGIGENERLDVRRLLRNDLSDAEIKRSVRRVIENGSVDFCGN
ncbi:MAG: radical SAM protein [Clostridiales bacterium]|nr:radical SAM protein [Clostridiales bacterium]